MSGYVCVTSSGEGVCQGICDRFQGGVGLYCRVCMCDRLGEGYIAGYVCVTVLGRGILQDMYV